MKKIFTLLATVLVTLSVNAQTTITFWEGSKTMDSSWPSIAFDASNFATAKAGDKMVVTVSSASQTINPAWTYGGQLFFKYAENTEEAKWSDVPGFAAASITYSDETQVAEFKFTEEGATAVKESKGVFLQGMNVVVSKVEFVSVDPTAPVELTLTEGHTILSSEFDSYPDDYEVKFSFANTTEPYTSRNGWGIGGFANADNWTPTYEFKAADGATFDLYATVGDLKTAAKNGTEEYVVGQYHGTGITFNIYNDCKLTGVYVLVPSATAIQGVKAENYQAEAIYNLAGQKVSNDYKGVVIKNGKKYLNK